MYIAVLPRGKESAGCGLDWIGACLCVCACVHTSEVGVKSVMLLAYGYG